MNMLNNLFILSLLYYSLMPKLCSNCGRVVVHKDNLFICSGCSKRFSEWEYQHLDDEVTETGGHL